MVDVYQMVNDRIINALASGVVPWRRPWCLVNGGAFNRITGRPYSLLNQMCLKHSGEYATFDQWNSIGEIKKGAQAEKVVFWKKLEPKDEEGEEGDTKARFVLRYYNVFHISQVLGVEPLPSKEETHYHDRIQDAEGLVNGYIRRESIKLEEERSNRAYYSPKEDTVHIPAISQYLDVEEYYSTLMHELVHSTGHRKRLNRPGLTTVSFGSEEYSKEELIAEIGAASILNGLGIETVGSFTNSVAYIESWLSKLRDDKYLAVHAASAAERAVRYVYDANPASNA